MNVILSIKPKYVKEILKGYKKFEFRKNIYKQSIERIYIYSSSPVKRIVASFKPEEIIYDTPSNLWTICDDNAGISYDEFMEYFFNKQKGYAIKITDLNIFENPIAPKLVIEGFVPPQSFRYINSSVEKLPYLENGN